MDLIYEGITTRPVQHVVYCKVIVRMDLIYEGITTVTFVTVYCLPGDPSEWT